MEQWIYEQGKIVGRFAYVPRGLYYEVSCHMEQDMGIRRLYAVSGFHSAYIGIPDGSGMLCRNVKKKLLPQGIGCVLTSQRERGRWAPWRGALDGIAVEEAEVCEVGDEILLSLPPTEALRFPAWAKHFIFEESEDQSRMLLRLTSEGVPVASEIENGRDNNEENDSDFAEFSVPFESVAHDGNGFREHGEEAHCPDL